MIVINFYLYTQKDPTTLAVESLIV